MAMPLKTIFGIPGTLTLKGREFVIPQPTPADVARVHDRMRELAVSACVHPLASVNAIAGELNPGVLAESVRAAVAMGAGGGVEPTRESVHRQYETLAGVRFRVWFYAKKTTPGLTLDEVNALIPEDDRYDVADALFEAMGLASVDPKSEGPATGAS